MTQPIQITLDGKEITLRFNNASLHEIKKLVFDDPNKALDYSELLAEILKINEANYFFVCKIMIYSGVVGNDLEINRIKPTYTFEQVGQMVGKMSQEELADYTIKAWSGFWEEMGVNLEKIKEIEGAEPEKKK